ncbi:GAF domain-containing protein [Fodinibius sp.]|uniref:GAF domain-containing protein n=1 Tax=Fodinibius sp. TaxID=1872440 RepID=UPI0035678A68
MNNYAAAPEEDRSKAEIMGQKRQEKALREFKHVLKDLIFLLRSASGMQTVYMYWINRSREQFVLETKSTELDNVMFKDRLTFENHFLNEFKDISEPASREIGREMDPSLLKHYYDNVPVRYVTMLPFVNNGETVAITVLEARDQISADGQSDVIYSYIDALRNVLNTYLEISDLYEQQNEWIDYEKCLDRLNVRCHRAELVKRLLNILQEFLPDGGVSFVAQGMGSWCNVMNSDEARHPLPVGMTMEKRSLASEAAENGNTEFAIHFNNSPKRLSPREQHTEGATMAIPLLMNDRRQGVVLAHDKNPLTFKESTKHKLKNLVRVAGLQIMGNDPGIDIDEPVFANKFGAFLPDFWKKTVDAELLNIREEKSKFHSWFGLITLSNLPKLRTKMRIDQLDQMQRDLVRTFNPSQYGYTGILGFHSDYIYSFFIQNKDSEAVDKWIAALRKNFLNSFELDNGMHIETDITVGPVKLVGESQDSYQVLTKAKSALSGAMKSGNNEVQ